MSGLDNPVASPTRSLLLGVAGAALLLPSIVVTLVDAGLRLWRGRSPERASSLPSCSLGLPQHRGTAWGWPRCGGGLPVSAGPGRWRRARQGHIEVVRAAEVPGVIRVVVADDHPVFRYGLLAVPDGVDGIETVGEADAASSCPRWRSGSSAPTPACRSATSRRCSRS